MPKLHGIWARRAALAALAALVSAGSAEAQLVGGRVTAGGASITETAESALIVETTQRAIITWTGFSIPRGYSVTVQQPGASAVLLNRVTGGTPSYLLGTLSANGQVWIVNPAGIITGDGAQITAAGLLLSTAGISDANFLSGDAVFDEPGNPGAKVFNGGTITVSGGYAVLAGAQVANNGVIEARLGSVVLAGATTYTVDFSGDNLLSFAIATPSGATGALVANKGTIAADGGTVLLTAASAKAVLDNVINTSGIVEATSVSTQNGKIVLLASGGGTEVSGTLDASGKGAGESGGTVEVLGNSVTLAPGATVDVSGADGGGTALVGGNFRGAGPEPDAATTTVAAGARIIADALDQGDGGNVAVWSNGGTIFNGAISADGGAAGGNGGSVETSGGTLSVGASASVTALAPNGAVGRWLLDPQNIIVETGGAASLTEVGSFGADAGLTDTIAPATIVAGLESSDVTLEAGNDITVVNAIDATADPSATNSLTLQAGRSIALDASIALNGGSFAATVDDSTATVPTDRGAGAGNFVMAPGTAISTNGGGGIAIAVTASTVVSGVAFTAGAITLADLTTAGGSMDITGAALLGQASVAIVTTADGADGNFVTFSGTIDGTGAGGQALTIDAGTAAPALDGSIGQSVPVGAVTLEGGFIDLGANATAITTLGGAVTFGTQVNSSAPLAIDTTAAGRAAGAAVDFTSALNVAAPDALTVTAGTGTVTFSGGNGPFGAVSLSGGSIVLDGFNTAGGAVTINGPTVIVDPLYLDIDTTNGGAAAGASVAFNGPISVLAPGAFLYVTAGTGNLTFGGAIGSAAAPIGGMTVSGAAVSLAGNISSMPGFVNITGAITLQNSITIDNTFGSGMNFVDLYGTIDGTGAGGQALTINAGAGTLGGAVGSQVPLGALDANGSFFAVGGSSITTAGGAVAFSGQADLSGSLAVDTTAGGHAAGASVTFGSSVNMPDGTPGALAVNAGTAGTVTFSGGGNPFGAVTLTGGSIMLDGFNTAGGAVTINGPTVIADPLYLDIDTTNGGAAAGASVAFNGPISVLAPGAFLYVTAGTGNLTFGGAIGSAAAPIGGMTVSGAAVSLAGNISSMPGFVNITGAITLQNSITIDNTFGSGMNFVDLYGTIDGTGAGGQALTINAGAGTLGGAVGSQVPLGALDANGSFFNVGGSSITTAGGAVAFSGQADLSGSLAVDTTAGGHAAGASVTFGSSVNMPEGTPGALAVNGGTAGTVSLSGGGPFSTVSLAGGGIVLGSVTTIGAQSYGSGTLVLDGPYYQTSGGTFRASGTTYIAVPSVTIETTGQGASGASLSFGAIDSDVGGGLGVEAGTGGFSATAVGTGGALGSFIVTAASFAPLPAGALDVSGQASFNGGPIPVIVSTAAMTTIIPAIANTALTSSASASGGTSLGSALSSGDPADPVAGSPAPVAAPQGGVSGSSSTGTASPTSTLTAVADLDPSSQLFPAAAAGGATGAAGASAGAAASPGGQPANADPVTAIAAIRPASQAEPRPPEDDEPLGGSGTHIYRARAVAPRLIGVPGIDGPAPGAGNRALWFARPFE